MTKEMKVAPLSSGFMLTSIVGILISAFYVLPQSYSWGVTFLLFFAIMLVSSLISMTYSPGDSSLKK